MIVSTRSEKGNRLLVLGDIDESVQDMIHFGTTIGWSIYACKEEGRTQRPTDVHWLHPEYFEKVPMDDAPEFNGLVVVPSLSRRGAADRMVEKFRIRRIAIIQFVASPDGTNMDDVPELFEVKLNQETLAGNVMKDEMLDREARLFSLPSSSLAREGRAAGVQLDKTIQDCFSWLSK